MPPLSPFPFFSSGCGVNGLLDPVEPSLACGSDTAHMSIFGYEPRLYSPIHPLLLLLLLMLLLTLFILGRSLMQVLSRKGCL